MGGQTHEPVKDENAQNGAAETSQNVAETETVTETKNEVTEEVANGNNPEASAEETTTSPE